MKIVTNNRFTKADLIISDAFESVKDLVEDTVSRGLSLEEANLSEYDLSFANLTGGNFKNATFRYSVLRSVLFSRSDLSGADLSECNLEDVIVVSSSCRGAKMEASSLRNSYFRDVDLGAANLNSSVIGSVGTLEYRVKNLGIGRQVLQINSVGANGDYFLVFNTDLGPYVKVMVMNFDPVGMYRFSGPLSDFKDWIRTYPMEESQKSDFRRIIPMAKAFTKGDL
jgi:hypothetical protein